MLARNWWAVALRGLFAVLFGIAAFAWPELTLLSLVWLFGIYAVLDGIFSIVSAITNRQENDRWWLVLLEGIIGIAAGVVAFVWPGITAIALVYLIAAWAILTGIFEIVAAIRLRKEIEGEWLLALSGILSLIFGVALMIWPGAGALALVWVIAAYAIVFGVVLIILGFRMRGWRERGINQELTGTV
jgi:uncharacterized membrane protein HdeD (DUF308 family)